MKTDGNGNLYEMSIQVSALTEKGAVCVGAPLNIFAKDVCPRELQKLHLLQPQGLPHFPGVRARRR